MTGNVTGAVILLGWSLFEFIFLLRKKDRAIETGIGAGRQRFVWLYWVGLVGSGIVAIAMLAKLFWI